MSNSKMSMVKYLQQGDKNDILWSRLKVRGVSESKVKWTGESWEKKKVPQPDWSKLATGKKVNPTPHITSFKKGCPYKDDEEYWEALREAQDTDSPLGYWIPHLCYAVIDTDHPYTANAWLKVLKDTPYYNSRNKEGCYHFIVSSPHFEMIDSRIQFNKNNEANLDIITGSWCLFRTDKCNVFNPLEEPVEITEELLSQLPSGKEIWDKIMTRAYPGNPVNAVKEISSPPTITDFKAGLTLEKLRKNLQQVSGDNWNTYNNWMCLGNYLKAYSQAGVMDDDTAFEMWRLYSQQATDPQYSADHHTSKDKWDSYPKCNPPNDGWLINLVKRSGGVPEFACQVLTEYAFTDTSSDEEIALMTLFNPEENRPFKKKKLVELLTRLSPKYIMSSIFPNFGAEKTANWCSKYIDELARYVGSYLNCVSGSSAGIDETWWMVDYTENGDVAGDDAGIYASMKNRNVARTHIDRRFSGQIVAPYYICDKGISPKAKTTFPLFNYIFDNKLYRSYDYMDYKPAYYQKYDPMCDKRQLWNMWRGWNVDIRPSALEGDIDYDAISNILYHYKNIMFCKENYLNEECWEEAFVYFRKLVKMLLLGKKLGIIINTWGEKGSGKGRGWEYISRQILGKDYEGHFKNLEELKGRFTTLRAFKQILLVEEASSWGGDRDLWDVLKSYATSDIMKYEDKGKTPFYINDYSTIISMSNHPNAIRCEDKQARRPYAIRVSSERVGDRDYFKQLSIDMGDDLQTRPLTDTERRRAKYIAQEFTKWGMSADLTGFHPQISMPRTKDRIIGEMYACPTYIRFLRCMLFDWRDKNDELKCFGEIEQDVKVMDALMKFRDGDKDPANFTDTSTLTQSAIKAEFTNYKKKCIDIPVKTMFRLYERWCHKIGEVDKPATQANFQKYFKATIIGNKTVGEWMSYSNGKQRFYRIVPGKIRRKICNIIDRKYTMEIIRTSSIIKYKGKAQVNDCDSSDEEDSLDCF